MNHNKIFKTKEEYERIINTPAFKLKKKEKEAKKAYELLKEERANRKSVESITPVWSKKFDKAKGFIEKELFDKRRKENNLIMRFTSDKISFKLKHSYEKATYANSCRWHHTYIYYNFFLYLPKTAKIEYIDGLLTIIDIRKQRQIKNVIIYEEAYIVTKEELKKCKLAKIKNNDKVFYYHFEKFNANEIRCKIEANKHSKKAKETDNRYVTRQKYHKITGACYTGIDLWIKNNLTSNIKRIKVDELYPLLCETNAYGLDKFKKYYNL